MFERFDSDRTARTRRARWIGATIGVSALLHLAAGAALLVSAMWHIDKLSPDLDGPLAVQIGFPAAAPPPPPGSARPEPEKPTRQVSDDKVQPRPTRTVAEPEPGGDPNGETGGDKNGIVGSTGKTPAAPPGNVCQSVLGCDGKALPEPRPAAEPPRKRPVRVVRAAILEGQRIRGNPQIHPPETARNAMLRDGAQRTQAVVKLCLDTQGAPSAVELVKSSGYTEYDARLRAEIRTWRYRPYRLEDGTAIAVCTSIVFRYEMK